MKPFYAIVGITAALAFSVAHAAEESVATTINSAIKELESLPPKTTDEEFTRRIFLLARKLTQAEPDSMRLMAGLIVYMTTSECAPDLVMMLWPRIATSQERAQFLAGEIGQTQQSQIGFVTALVERELVDQQSLVKYPEARDAIGLDREVLYSGTAFVPIMQASGGVNPRLAAIWFSKAPYQAALACLGGHDEETKLHLQRVNNLRFEIEEGKSDEQKKQSWRKLDQELQSLFLSGSPVLEMYAAGVLKWRRTVEASFSESDALTMAINKCSNPVVGCILQGITIETLTSLPSDKIILVSTTNPNVAPTAAVAQPTPIPLTATSDHLPKSVSSSSPGAQVEASKSPPWPWIIGAILVLAIAGGILLKLRRK